jgi:murein L,D-transpeptidase YafK
LFEVTGQPPQVGYCGRSYAFAATGAAALPTDPLAACPPDAATVSPLIASKQQADERAAQSLIAEGTALSAHAYADGGMHPVFRKLLERKGSQSLAKRTSRTAVPVSRPDAALADPHDPRVEP